MGALCTVGALVLAATAGWSGASPSPSGSSTPSASSSSNQSSTPALDPQIQQILNKPIYQHGQFGILVVDSGGHTVTSLNPGRLFVPGSTTKLFTLSTAWDSFGPDQRTTTPLLAAGRINGQTLAGNLVLVASGDLTLGGRLKADGTIDFTPVDHTYAAAFPTLAGITPEDPLAGLNSLARQVKAAGITHVAGDVVVDNLLFAPDPMLTAVPPPTPIILNDNLIDILSTPGPAGQPATVSWRPQTSATKLDYHVKTVAAGQPSKITATPGPGGVITVSGTLAADTKQWLTVVPVADPAAFARSAMIDALKRAGVAVDAAPTGPDPAPPASEAGDKTVAKLVSPPFHQEARLILKVSHNLGADLMVCMLAVHAGSKDCQTGFAAIKAFDDKVGIDPAQASQADGQGGVEADAFTPQAYIPMLKSWTTRPDGTAFREALPILGVDGDLALFGADSPAKGKVFAKTGTIANGNALTGTFLIGGRAEAGYLDAGGGRFDEFAVMFNGGQVPTSDQILAVAQDISQITTILQQNAAAH